MPVAASGRITGVIKRWHYAVIAALLITGLLAGLVLHAYNRALPSIQPVASAATTAITGTPNIAWSGYGKQAMTVAGRPDLTEANEASGQLPTASIAKVVTALAILKQKPLASGQQGPNISINADEVAVYERDLAQNQSVIKVAAGEQLSEYQALQAMLVPSATNIADIAAPWAFGSMDNYLTFANQYVTSLGLTNTHIADASGFSPSTVSTPLDLLKLGEVAMQNPVIAEIVGQRSIDLPVAGTIHNFNISLGINGINGIKTGNTDEAGGTLLFSAAYNGQTIIGAVMNAPDLGTALHDAPEVLASYERNLQTITAVKVGEVVGHYDLPWVGTVNAVAQKDISALGWRDSKLPTTISLKPITATQDPKKPVGQVTVTANGQTQSTPVVIEHGAAQPSFWWRITHR
jgi:D-alanyl-D-alanine carboxypeptidase (penicillin-binding protein 5/6)